MRRSSPALLRVLTGQGLIPRPRWLEKLLTLGDRRPVRVDLNRLNNSDLAAMGVSRDELAAQQCETDWDPPEYWLNRTEPRPGCSKC